MMHMVCLLSIAGAAAQTGAPQTAPQWAFKKPDLRRMMVAASKMPDSMIADAKRLLTEQGRRMDPLDEMGEEEKADRSPECEAVCPGVPAIGNDADGRAKMMNASVGMEERMNRIYGPICDEHQEKVKCSMREAACQGKAPSDDALKKSLAELDAMCSGLACRKACPKLADVPRQTDKFREINVTLWKCENKISECVAAEPSCRGSSVEKEMFTEETLASMNLQCKYLSNGCSEKMESKETRNCQDTAKKPTRQIRDEFSCDTVWNSNETANETTVCCKATKDEVACGDGCMETMIAMMMAKKDKARDEEKEMIKVVKKIATVCPDVGFSVAELEAQVEDAEAESSPVASADGAVVNTISVTAILVSLLTLAKTM